MRMHGKKLERPNREIIAIPRADSDDIIFIAQAVLNYDQFNALCPQPKPGTKLMKGGEKVLDFESSTYKAELTAYSGRRYSWMVLEALKETPGLQWETVDYSDPSTWNNFEKELRESGFSDIEVNRILKGVSDANCLNEDKVEAARKRFLAGIGQEVPGESSSHLPALHSTPSGELVKVGESDPPASPPTPGTT
jgi:hypothetical protein